METFTKINEEEIPTNLKDLLDTGKLDDYQIRSVYFLELKPHLRSYRSFPAIINDGTERIVFTTSKEIIEEIWKSFLPLSESRMGVIKCHVHKEFSVGYASHFKGGDSQSLPIHLIDKKEFQILKEKDRPFKWAPGLEIDDMLEEEFYGTLEPLLRRE